MVGLLRRGQLKSSAGLGRIRSLTHDALYIHRMPFDLKSIGEHQAGPPRVVQEESTRASSWPKTSSGIR